MEPVWNLYKKKYLRNPIRISDLEVYGTCMEPLNVEISVSLAFSGLAHFFKLLACFIFCSLSGKDLPPFCSSFISPINLSDIALCRIESVWHCPLPKQSRLALSLSWCNLLLLLLFLIISPASLLLSPPFSALLSLSRMLARSLSLWKKNILSLKAQPSMVKSFCPILQFPFQFFFPSLFSDSHAKPAGLFSFSSTTVALCTIFSQNNFGSSSSYLAQVLLSQFLNASILSPIWIPWTWLVRAPGQEPIVLFGPLRPPWLVSWSCGHRPFSFIHSDQCC